MPPAAPALELRDLHYRYGRVDAVRGVSLRLEPGDCYGFLGHNGAGKTTVMRLALGLLQPRAGSVHVLGHDARQQPRFARAAVGALIERPGFHPHATARQNLVWLARLQGMPRRLAAAESSHVLEQLGLADAAGRRVGGFSMGMRQRLGVAAALLGRPRLLLLDEPGNGLDPEGIADLRRLLRHLADDGVTVLLSSHQLLELDGLCNRIGVLRDGAIVAEGDLDSLRARLGTRHVVQGAPLPALERRLRELGLAPVNDGARLLVALGDRAPGAVARELCGAGDLIAFAPEPASLETIYLQAARGDLGAAPTSSATTPAAATGATAPAPAVKGWRRAFAHELRTLLARRTTAPVLLVPTAIAAWSVFAHQRRVAHGLRRVAAGELFSADAGSAFVATAHALEASIPLLAVGVLLLGSQSVAGDLVGDTLRNTLMRSVSRLDVLFAKFAALLVGAGLGLAALVVVTTAAASAALGFGDLEEVTRHGDRQVLAAATAVAPVLWRALLHCVLPLAAATAIGLAASVVAKRPARAIGIALLAVLTPEVGRDALREHAGWLLTSHLPTGLRDDSVLGFLAATARGAADAFWPWRDVALAAPAVWMSVALAVAVVTMRRLRVP